MSRLLQIATLIVSAVVLASCAKQSSSGPAGGPEDLTPPVVVESNPPDKTVNFSAKIFEVTFDEYFVLDNVSQKLMVSPPFEKTPEIKIKKKTLLVSFEEELRDSVTYTFYFLDAIKDLNANNPVDNFQYVFSTGPVLDSLSVTGKVLDALTLDPGEEVFIMLYSGENDSLPLTTIPEYIAKAGKDGKFRIDNIAGGTYSIYGLSDLNNNKIFDLPDENFSFLDSTITLTAANNYIGSMPDSLPSRADSLMYDKIPGKEYELFSFVEEFTQQYMTSSDREEAYKLRYIFKMPVDSGQFGVEFYEHENIKYLIEESLQKDTITVWILDSLSYSLQTIRNITSYPQTDSTGAIKIMKDTMTFRYMAPRQPRGRAQTKTSALKLKHNGSGRSGFKPGKKLILSFDKPIQRVDTALLNIYVLDDTNRIKLDYKLSQDTVLSNRFILDYNFIEDSSYVAVWEKAAFTDIFGNKSDSAGVKLDIRNKDSYGTLKLTLSGYEGSIILQLITKDGKLAEEKHISLPEQSEVYFPLLEKGDYIVKAILDLNGDGKWTTGDFESHRQAEPVAFNPGIINIKVQWDLEQDWEIKEINKKGENLKTDSSRR